MYSRAVQRSKSSKEHTTRVDEKKEKYLRESRAPTRGKLRRVRKLVNASKSSKERATDRVRSRERQKKEKKRSPWDRSVQFSVERGPYGGFVARSVSRSSLTRVAVVKATKSCNRDSIEEVEATRRRLAIRHRAGLRLRAFTNSFHSKRRRGRSTH